MMWLILLSLSLSSLVSGQTLYFKPHGGATSTNNIVCPDKHGSCPSYSTCCMSLSGSYQCCPLKQGVCCKDGAHCCPSGYQCNHKGTLCYKGDDTHPWTQLRQADVPPQQPKKQQQQQPHQQRQQQQQQENTSSSSASSHPAKALIKKKVICPGGKTFCDDGKTCCFKDKWHFNCCPFVNGVCCSDGAHCCPLGFMCDVKLDKCTKGGELTLPWGQTHESKKDEPEPEKQIHSLEGQSVICPDGTSECPDGSTCCIMLSGQYGCCPLKQAVCCKDHLHCCPQRTVCDQQHATCKASGLHSIQWIRTTGHVSGEQTENGQCADNKTKCPDDTTCCPMLDGYYACCPFKNAKCCSDKLHCCPSDEECDIEKGECIKRENEKSSMTPLSATPATSEDRVICPDHQSCQSGSTCCQISATIYGCCPFSNAVCCSDHTHCCPAGYTCDVTAGTCQSTGSSIPWLTKREAQPVAPSEMNKPIRSIDRNLPVGDNKVICPDHTSFCPDQTTCCMLQSGQYGCCPLPNAVCCADHQHCCPTGYKCDVKKSTCLKSEDEIPWQQTTQPQAVSVKATWVPCPDHRTQCPDGETCCILSSGQYGCCPIPNAVCCSDHLHCCPSGMICDPPYCRHASNSLTISWSLLNTRPSLANTALTQQQQQQQAEVTCRDHTFCAAESTCCIMTSGQYGCCPYPKATCCADKLHCCPEGFQCDKTGMRCEKSGSSIRLTSTLFTRFKPAPPRELTNDANNVKCPDGKKQCPEGSTCCKTPTGQYTCCPFVSAVCCKDGVHCCPQGYVCDPQSGSCTQAVPWLTKVPASSRVQHRSSSIICPDHEHQCPEYNTCCLLQGGEWGCCPLPMAVCCSDGVHCCPTGYTCDVGRGMCLHHGDGSLPFLDVTTKAHSHQQP